MPTDDFYVICPYYHKVLGNNIFCEGISASAQLPTEGCFSKQVFPDRGSRNNCIRSLCATFHYPRCRIAALNEAVQAVSGGKSPS